MTLTDAIREDAKRMEDAAIRTSQRADIWQDRIIYWMCVAILHLIEWVLMKGDK